jgi:hypothetical protein
MISLKVTCPFERKTLLTASAMALAFVCAGAAMAARPQQRMAVAQANLQAGATDNGRSGAESKRHGDAVKLVELMAVREKVKENAPKMVEAGAEEMKTQFPNFDSRFSDEWARRMLTQLNPDDFVKVYVRVYEKYFTADELEQLIAAQVAINNSKAPVLSPPLLAKVKENAIAMQSAIMGGCTEVGAKLGGEIGQEITKEHPDWARTPKPGSQSAPK